MTFSKREARLLPHMLLMPKSSLMLLAKEFPSSTYGYSFYKCLFITKVFLRLPTYFFQTRFQLLHSCFYHGTPLVQISRPTIAPYVTYLHPSQLPCLLCDKFPPNGKLHCEEHMCQLWLKHPVPLVPIVCQKPCAEGSYYCLEHTRGNRGECGLERLRRAHLHRMD